MYKSSRITDDSYVELKNMQQVCYGSSHSIDEFNNKYDTSIFGLKNTGFIARNENGEDAAYYGVFPIIIDYESNSFLVAQSGDTMTMPEHRKKGLFVALAKETYQFAHENGVKLVYGFPNENSYPGFKNKLDWVFNAFMQKFTISAKCIPFCELSFKFKALRRFYESRLNKKMRRYSLEPTAENIKDFNYCEVKGLVKKDKNFFAYKLRNDNVFLINFNGFKMLVKVSDHLHIGEIARFELNETDKLLASIRQLAAKLGCKKAIITISENHWLFRALREKIDYGQSLPIGFYKYDDTFETDKIQFCHADYDTF